MRKRRKHTAAVLLRPLKAGTSERGEGGGNVCGVKKKNRPPQFKEVFKNVLPHAHTLSVQILTTFLAFTHHFPPSLISMNRRVKSPTVSHMSASGVLSFFPSKLFQHRNSASFSYSQTIFISQQQKKRKRQRGMIMAGARHTL